MYVKKPEPFKDRLIKQCAKTPPIDVLAKCAPDAGPEFGEHKGHTLLINKALYGLKSSGLRWHERFSEVLMDMGFTPLRVEQNIWMCEKDGTYEYIRI